MISNVSGLPTDVFNSIVELLLTTNDVEERKVIMKILGSDKVTSIYGPDFDLTRVLNRLSTHRRSKYNFSVDDKEASFKSQKSERFKSNDETSNDECNPISELPRHVFIAMTDLLLSTEDKEERLEIIRLVCSEKLADLYSPDFDLSKVIKRISRKKFERKSTENFNFTRKISEITKQDSAELYGEIDNLILTNSGKLKKVELSSKKQNANISAHTVDTIETNNSVEISSPTVVGEEIRKKSLRTRLSGLFCM